MPVNDSESYLEQCIAALPPEKREAARHAFAEISETGDDSYLSKLLAVMEANNTYAKKIPKELAEAGGKLVRDMACVADKLAGRQSEDEARSEARLRTLLVEQFSGFAKLQALDAIAAGIERQRLLLEQLNRSKWQPKEESGAGMFFMLIFGCLIGCGLTVWFFWGEYQGVREAQSFVTQSVDAGIRMRVDKTEAGNRLVVVGPVMKGGEWRKGDDGLLNGVEIDFSNPK
jgi:hypothetical protein